MDPLSNQVFLWEPGSQSNAGEKSAVNPGNGLSTCPPSPAG